MHNTWVSAVKVLRPKIKTTIEKPIIENTVFRLHSKVTTLLLLTFFIVVCTREYFGDHIKCLNENKKEEKIINNYCFFMTTFTIEDKQNRHLLEGNIPHPGLGPVGKHDKTVKHKYYQWVPFVLFFQCVCFYIPHYIWKREEGGRMKALVSSLENARLALHDEEVKVKDKKLPTRSALTKKVELIGKDILLRLQVTRSWSVGLVTLEVLNLLHLILQIWITNSFLNGKFLTLGSDWLRYDPRNKTGVNPLEIVFPRMTKCVYHKFGPSGSLVNYDVMCVLSLNILYEKIYTILWFWFLILFIASVLALVWRLVSFYLYRKPYFTQLMYKRVTPGNLDLNVVGYIIRRCHFADWLFLYYLAKNMPGFIFEELFQHLYDELKRREDEASDSYDSNNETLLLPRRKKIYTEHCTVVNEDKGPVH